MVRCMDAPGRRGQDRTRVLRPSRDPYLEGRGPAQAGDLTRDPSSGAAHSCGTAPDSHRLRWSAPIGREADVRPYRFPHHTGGVRSAVVVLAGGASRRWGGRDKTSVLLGDRTVLEHAVGSLLAGAGVGPADAVVVGPLDHVARAGLAGVRGGREEPAGGGAGAAPPFFLSPPPPGGVGGGAGGGAVARGG